MARGVPRILAVGYHSFDVVVPVAGFPRPDQKTEVERIRIGGGGPAATAAVALARLGARVRLVTPLTDDLGGRLQRRELQEAGVDLALCPVCRGRESPRAVILVDSRRQERTIFAARGGLPLLDPDLARPDWVEGIDLLHCDGHDCPIATRLADWARRAGRPVVLDAGTVREGSAELVALCTDVISSQSFAPVLTGRSDPVAALAGLSALGPSRVGMTFGAEGALGLVEGKPMAVPAFRVPVLDTTGAGDAFHAGYSFARARGLALPACLEFGAAVAGLKCRDWGGRAGLPILEEVETLIREGGRLPLGPRLAGFPRFGH